MMGDQNGDPFFSEEEELGLVRQPPQQVITEAPPISIKDQMEDILSAAMMMAKFSRQIVEKAVQITGPKDWTDQGGKPYLIEYGAAKVASVLPIKTWYIENPGKQWSEDEKGKFYMYVCTCGAAWKGGLGEVSATGTRSSREKFFSSRRGQELPQSEVSETNIMKACGTNGRRNAIVRLTGLGNLTWEELEEMAGIKRDSATKVEYKSQKKAPENPEEDDKQRQELRQILLEMNNEDAGEAGNHLEKLTTFKGRDGQMVPGKKSIGHLTEKAVGVTLSKIRKEHKEWKKEQK